jgi:hypothetical protein
MYMRFPEAEFARIAEAERLDERGDRAFLALREEFIARYFEDRPAVPASV